MLLGSALGEIFTLVYMVIEALGLFGALVLIARWAIHAPYCHTCRCYCERFEDIGRFASAPLVQAVERIQVRDWGVFRSLGAPRPHAPEWLRLDIATCPSCGRSNTVSLQVVTQGGQHCDSMVQDLQITEDDLRTVQRLSVSRSATYM